jgi:predicted flap endonuclease-1-like 5' DNA nuclease
VLAESGIKTFDDLAGIAEDFQVVNGIGPMKAEDLSEAWDEIVSD